MSGVILGRRRDNDSIEIDPAMRLWPLVDADACKDMDCVYVTLNGVHTRRVNRRSHKLYVVIAGTLELRTGDNVQKIGANDAAIVPAGTWCELYGADAQVMIVCAPAFSAQDEEIERYA